MPLVYVLCGMEKSGVRIDVEALHKLSVDFTKKLGYKIENRGISETLLLKKI